MCPFVERMFLSHTAHSQIVAQQRPMPKCTIIVSELVAFLSNVFLPYFVFIGCDPQVVGGHLVLIWSPLRLLYHN